MTDSTGSCKRTIRIRTVLYAKAWSAIAAGYLITMNAGAIVDVDEAGAAASSFFDDLIPGDDRAVFGGTMVEAFSAAAELCFRIAVATLTLKPDDALPAIGGMVERARQEFRDIIGNAVPA